MPKHILLASLSLIVFMIKSAAWRGMEAVSCGHQFSDDKQFRASWSCTAICRDQRSSLHLNTFVLSVPCFEHKSQVAGP